MPRLRQTFATLLAVAPIFIATRTALGQSSDVCADEGQSARLTLPGGNSQQSGFSAANLSLRYLFTATANYGSPSHLRINWRTAAPIAVSKTYWFQGKEYPAPTDVTLDSYSEFEGTVYRIGGGTVFTFRGNATHRAFGTEPQCGGNQSTEYAFGSGLVAARSTKESLEAYLKTLRLEVRAVTPVRYFGIENKLIAVINAERQEAARQEAARQQAARVAPAPVATTPPASATQPSSAPPSNSRADADAAAARSASQREKYNRAESYYSSRLYAAARPLYNELLSDPSYRGIAESRLSAMQSADQQAAEDQRRASAEFGDATKTVIGDAIRDGRRVGLLSGMNTGPINCAPGAKPSTCSLEDYNTYGLMFGIGGLSYMHVSMSPAMLGKVMGDTLATADALMYSFGFLLGSKKISMVDESAGLWPFLSASVIFGAEESEVSMGFGVGFRFGSMDFLLGISPFSATTVGSLGLAFKL
jgi:hypothetical protein